MQRLGVVLSLLFMPLVLALAYGLDRWVFIQRRLAGATFDYQPLLLALVASALLLAASWVLLAWWTLARGRAWYVSLVFILGGLAVLLYPPLRMLAGWSIFFPLRFIYQPDDRLAFTGAFLAVLGALSWLLAGRTRSQDV